MIDFITEDAAKIYLENLLSPYFILKREVWCRHLLADNRLKIDYVGRPKDGVVFPFDWFGIEVKKTMHLRDLANASKQAIDYTYCIVDDERISLARIKSSRIERVYLFPGLDQKEEYRLVRLLGSLHVGMIYVENRTDEINPFSSFYASGDRQWCAHYGSVKRKHNSHQRVGSGVDRKV